MCVFCCFGGSGGGGGGGAGYLQITFSVGTPVGLRGVGSGFLQRTVSGIYLSEVLLLLVARLLVTLSVRCSRQQNNVLSFSVPVVGRTA